MNSFFWFCMGVLATLAVRYGWKWFFTKKLPSMVADGARQSLGSERPQGKDDVR